MRILVPTNDIGVKIYRKVAGGFEDFQKKWGLLPKPLAVAIHDKCLEVNPDWDYRLRGDEEEGE